MKKFVKNSNINQEMVFDALRSWGDLVISLADFLYLSSKADVDGANDLDADIQAKSMIKKIYRFTEESPKIIFKPTLSSGKSTFRNSLEETLSYFINDLNDVGFAKNNWKNITFYNSSLEIIDNIAITSGLYMFSQKTDDREDCCEILKSKDTLGDNGYISKNINIFKWKDYPHDYHCDSQIQFLKVQAHYTFVYQLTEEENRLKIIAHHSSKPIE